MPLSGGFFVRFCRWSSINVRRRIGRAKRRSSDYRGCGTFPPLYKEMLISNRPILLKLKAMPLMGAPHE